MDSLEFVIPACGQPESSEFGLILRFILDPGFRRGDVRKKVKNPKFAKVELIIIPRYNLLSIP